MLCPPHGVCLPCQLDRVIDGDTVSVRCLDRIWHVRLLECWAPETRGPEKPEGLESKSFLEDLLAEEEDLSVFIPHAEHGNMMHAFTMGRILGRLFVGTEDVSAIMVRHGLARVTKA